MCMPLLIGAMRLRARIPVRRLLRVHMRVYASIITRSYLRVRACESLVDTNRHDINFCCESHVHTYLVIVITRISVFEMVLSEKQKNRLQTQGRYAENFKVASQMLGIRQGSLNSCNTRIFVDFIELLDAMNDYYPIFERRFRHSPESIRQMRSLTRKIKKSTS